MARVVLTGDLCRAFTGGVREMKVTARSIRHLIAELDAHFPGLGRQVEESMAIAIDGTIYQDFYAAPLSAESEVYLIPRIGGG